MPSISLPAAIVGAGVIGGGAAIIGGSKAASAAKSATNSNNALQTQIYDQNTANESPFMQRGQQAGQNINALLGLGGDANAANSAFNQYQNSDGYQFRLNQGENGIAQNKVINGLLQSGSALKASQAYGQNLGSQEFGNYLGQLGNQQGVGLSAANALAGVGTNYANAVSQNNNNAANQTGNAALSSANSINGLLNNGVNALGQYYGQSSYGQPAVRSGYSQGF